MMMINKQNIPSLFSLSVSHRGVLYLAMIGVFIELSLLLWYINVSSARLGSQNKVSLIVFWTIANTRAVADRVVEPNCNDNEEF